MHIYDYVYMYDTCKQIWDREGTPASRVKGPSRVLLNVTCREKPRGSGSGDFFAWLLLGWGWLPSKHACMHECGVQCIQRIQVASSDWLARTLGVCVCLRYTLCTPVFACFCAFLFSSLIACMPAALAAGHPAPGPRIYGASTVPYSMYSMYRSHGMYSCTLCTVCTVCIVQYLQYVQIVR